MNIPKTIAPEGMEWYFNEILYTWILRPIKGYSEKYLNMNTFIPKNNNSGKYFEEVKKSETGAGKNVNLTVSKNNKNDEFYTKLEDITNELKHYKEHFVGKIIYCPCDKCFNLGRSEFSNYFLSKFHSLGIKKLICTQYNPYGFGSVTEYKLDGGIKWEYNGEYSDDIKIDESMIDTYILKDDGSFFNYECQKILRECDIVVTNPPFSLFREFVNQIMAYDKKFLIIGNKNAITYKEIFPHIKNNKIWLGYSSPKEFMTPEGEVTKKLNGLTRWFTNLKHEKRFEDLYLGKHYLPDMYEKYDNYDAINVGKVVDIPCDYDGIMAVPVTFLDSYNPNQFEIIGQLNVGCFMDENGWQGSDGKNMLMINGKTTYKRILIKKL